MIAITIPTPFSTISLALAIATFLRTHAMEISVYYRIISGREQTHILIVLWLVVVNAMGLVRYFKVLFGKARGKEPAVIIGEQTFDVSYRYPKNTENHAWDDDHYAEGNIFVEGQANPVKIQKSDVKEKCEFIESEKYKTAMQQSVLSDAFDTFGRSEQLMKQLLVGSLILHFVTILIIAVGLFG